MPTITIQIGASLDDVTEQITATPDVSKSMTSTASQLQVALFTIVTSDYDVRIGLRFDMSSLPDGAIISSASLEGYVPGGGGAQIDQGDCRASVFDEADAAAFNTGNSATFPSNRTKLVQQVDGPSSTVLGDDFYVFGDIADAVQAWLALGSGTGRHMGVQIHKFQNPVFSLAHNAEAWDATGSNQFRLVIDYSLDDGQAMGVIV